VALLFDGAFRVHYSQAYVLPPGGVNSDLEAAFVGQQNGLLGAAVPGQLWVTTGLHTGDVRFRVEYVASEPAADEAWQEVVEASFTPDDAGAALTGWAGESGPVPLPLDVAPYRARLCASSMDEARQADTLLDGEEPKDRYLLVFWRAQPMPDQVIKQTSGTAAYWNGWAQSLQRA
jgi:hypothetical protein